MEWIISGYCRVQDQARTVLLEREDGQWDCDCNFPGCTYAEVCTLGQNMTKIQEEHP